MKDTRKIKRGIPLKLIVIIMCGIIFSFSCGAMWISGTFNLDCFFDIGKVYDVQNLFRNAEEAGLVYSEKDNGLLVTDDEVYKNIEIAGDMQCWRTLVLDIQNMNKESMIWKINFLDKDKVLLSSQQEQISEGENIITLPGEKFAYIQILFLNDAGAVFRIDKMQLLEGNELIAPQKIIGISAVFFILYLLCVRLVKKVWKKWGWKKNIDFYVMIDKLQEIYIKIGSQMPDMNKYPLKHTAAGRRMVLLVMLYYMLIINNRDTYFRPEYFLRHILVWGICLLAVAVLAKEKPLRKLNWRHPYTAIWSILWIMIAISDFIIKKRLTGWGYLMFFVGGFLFFVWGNMERPQRLLKDMIRAIEYFSVINLLFCFVARPKLEGYAYSGIAWNPNIYIQYLMPMLVVFLVELLNWLESGRRKKVWIFDLFFVMASLYMVWISQSRTAILAAAAIVLVFFWRVIGCLSKKETGKRCWKTGIAATILVIPAVVVCEWCISTIPKNLGTQVIFPRDDYKIEVEVPSFVIKAQAAGMAEEIRNSSVVTKFLNISDIESFSSGRNLYWNAYLRNMNLWGHEYQLEIWGIKRGEHSGFITIAYRYGVLAIIPYMLLIACTIKNAWKYMKQEKKYGRYTFFPIGIALGMLCILLVENVERPFYSVSCLAFWLLPGMFMNGVPEKQEIKENE